MEGGYEHLATKADLLEMAARLEAKIDAKVDGKADALRREMNTKFNIIIVALSTIGVGMAGGLFTVALRLP